MKTQVHHPYFLNLVHNLEPLLRQHPPLARMSFDDLADWISWYWNRGTMSWVIDSGGAQGVCLIRLFRRLDQMDNRDVHEPCGQFVMLELMIAKQPLAMGQICADLTNRWGPQKVVMWDRGSRTENDCPRIYSWDQFQKLARRISYGVIETA